MRVRKATKKDLKTIIELSDQLVLEHDKRFPAYPKLAKDIHSPKVRYFRNLFSKRNSGFFVAIENEEIVGFVMGFEKKDPPLFAETKIGAVGDFYVQPEFRSKGVGHKLFAELKKWFRKKGFKTLEIGFHSRNTKARRLYEELGFRPHKELWRIRI